MSKLIRKIFKGNVVEEIDVINIKACDLTGLIERMIDGLETILEEIAEEIVVENGDEKREEFKIGDVFWIVSGDGEVDDTWWVDDNFDNAALNNNAIFKTQEEAEFEAERLKVLRELEKLGRAYEKDNFNFMIYINGKNNITTSEVMFNGFYGNYYFDSEEEAEKAIEKIGEERIKKYLFRIGEE